MSTDEDLLALDRIAARDAEHRDEFGGLVPLTPDSPMLQPWEVYDQDLFDLEMVRVFGRSWVWLGDTEDLQEPGDFITGRIGMQAVIVVRQTDGSVKGFLNNCRHRASGLEFEPAGNCGKTLTCPYHNWAYSIDGTLVGIPDKVGCTPTTSPWRTTAWSRSASRWRGTSSSSAAWSQAPAFREWIAPLADRYDPYDIGPFRRFHRELDQTYPINWKAFVENSNDDYHVRFVHRRLNPLRHHIDTIVRFEGRTCSGYKPHKPEVEDPSGGRTDLPEEWLRGNYADFILPNLTPLPYPTQLILVRADPIAPDRTRLFSRIYGLTETSKNRRTPPEPGGDQQGGHRHGHHPHGEPALTLLPGRPSVGLGTARGARHAHDQGGCGDAVGAR